MDIHAFWLGLDPVIRKVLSGAGGGLVTAAAVDFRAWVTFRKWQAFAAYDWNEATLRWAIGIVTGIATAFGLSFAG